jgi:hypothetical protein
MKKKLWWFGIPVAIGVYLIYKQFSKPKDPKDPKDPEEVSVYPLKKGSKNSVVGQLQNLLLSCNPKALPKYGADNDFGTETETALLKYTGKKTVDSQAELYKINCFKINLGLW